MKYQVILVDCHTLADGLRGRDLGAAVVEFHRLLALLASRYLDRENPRQTSARGGVHSPCVDIAIIGDGDGLRRDICVAARNLGLAVVRGRSQRQLFAARVNDCQRDGASCLIVSDDPGATALLADSPQPTHVLQGLASIARLVTRADYAREGIVQPTEAEGDGTITVEVRRPDLRAHRWWLASRGAEDALMPDCWRRIERMAK